MAPIDELRRILLAPENPIGTGSPDEWDRLEARLGTRLPEDYKQFVGTYGAGWVAMPHDEFSVINPFAGSRSARLERALATQRAAHAAIVEIHARYGDAPEQPDGLIRWGANSFRGICFWEPNTPDADLWTVHSEIDDDRKSYPENMTTYLMNVFRGVHDYFIYNVERTEFRLPMVFTRASVLTEVTVPLAALREPGPVETPALVEAGLALEVLPTPDQMFLAVRLPRLVSVELVDESGEWMGVLPVGLHGSGDPSFYDVGWPSGLHEMFAHAIVLECHA